MVHVSLVLWRVQGWRRASRAMGVLRMAQHHFPLAFPAGLPHPDWVLCCTCACALPIQVWRIPLTSTADPAAYKLSPELSVAAGALASQLQKNGKIEGRGRTNRSSCPVY
jgi:hypothetical protein